MSNHQAVITGAGCVSSLGVHLDELAAALAEARSGVGLISGFDAAPYPSRHGAEVRGLDLAEFIDSSKTYLDRTSAFTLAACSDALRQAGWLGDESVGLVLGTAWGCLDSLELFAEKFVGGNPKFVSPLPFTHSYANAPNCLAAIEFKLRGFSACITCGQTAGAAAIEYACRRIRLGKAARLLAGGAEALSEPIHHLCGLRGQLSPDGSVSPYDAQSRGTVLGEGAAIFALEDAAYARERGAHVLAQILGCGAATGTTVADGLTRSMQRALADAAIGPCDVGLVVGIGCGLPALDAAELDALEATFGHCLPVLATIKALTGETQGAAGPLSLAAALGWLAGQVPHGALVADLPGQEAGTTLVNASDPSGSSVTFVVAAT